MSAIVYSILGVFVLLIIYLSWKAIDWLNSLCDQVKKPECHCCGAETELELTCEKCDEFYCDNCSANYNYNSDKEDNKCMKCSPHY